MGLPLVPKDDGADARPVDPAVPTVPVAVLPQAMVEAAVPMVPAG